MMGVTSAYHDLCEVFSKGKATSLPNTSRTFVPSTCSWELRPPKVGSILCLRWNEWPWRSILTSHWLQGSFFVDKRNKSLWPFIDYWGLNKITVKNHYLLPLILLVLLQGANVFTKPELHNAHHLLCIGEGDKWKTAFNIPIGHYEYLVMLFGLTNAPAIFQGLVNDVLWDILNKFVFMYLGDILTFSRKQTNHIQYVQAALQRLLENTLFVKPEKCDFYSPLVSFLGHIITRKHADGPCHGCGSCSLATPSFPKASAVLFRVRQFLSAVHSGLQHCSSTIHKTRQHQENICRCRHRIPPIEGAVHHGSLPAGAELRLTVHSGGGCLRHGSQGCKGPEAAPLRLLLSSWVMTSSVHSGQGQSSQCSQNPLQVLRCLFCLSVLVNKVGFEHPHK